MLAFSLLIPCLTIDNFYVKAIVLHQNRKGLQCASIFKPRSFSIVAGRFEILLTSPRRYHSG